MIHLVLRSANEPIEHWELVLPQALSSIRSFLCTAKHTPHERMFTHVRRSTNGACISIWLTVLERVLVANVRESTVSNRHLAPLG